MVTIPISFEKITSVGVVGNPEERWALASTRDPGRAPLERRELGGKQKITADGENSKHSGRQCGRSLLVFRFMVGR